ncbi:MAG TPA: MFS transporter [Pseudonocardiaceae bacterium]|nr:MFS transporter [Pseudonocardiaceae bacterium]
MTQRADGVPTVPATESAEVAPRGLRLVVLTMAVACGLAVANLYYAQPLLALVADSFRVSQGTATIVVTATQFGYAIGLLVLLPLGDLVNNRTLTSRTLIGTAVALAIAALSPAFGLFLAMSVLIGITSVVAQILIPLAAHLAPEHSRGRFVGQMMSGLLLGILLARTVASLVAAEWGWRSIYVVSAVLMVVMSVALARVLPNRPPDHTASYRTLMASVLDLARTQALLRRRAFCQAMLFGAFTSFWTAIAYELIGVHHLNQVAVGIFALVGAAGAAVAPLAGKLADRGHGHYGRLVAIVIGICAMLLACFGAGSVILLGLAGVLLDLSVQGHQVFSQRDIYSLRGDARARINTVFMTTIFVGGAAASAVSGWLHDTFGWTGVCLFGAALLVLAAVVWTVGHLGRSDYPEPAEKATI